MKCYKISELIGLLSEMVSDGFDYTSITLLPEEDDLPPSIGFEAICDPFSSVDYEDIEALDLPDKYDFESSTIEVSPDEHSDLSFTYLELVILEQALGNALEYAKECLKETSYSSEERLHIKSDTVNYRNLRAKLVKFFKRIHFH